MALDERSIRQFRGQVASDAPTPGGGAVVGISASVSASLAVMVTRFSQGRDGSEANEALFAEMVDSFARASDMFTQLADEDILAYQQMSDLLRLPKDEPRRTSEMPEAIRGAVRVPLAMMGLCLSLLRRLEELAPVANPWLLSDLAIACEMTASAGLAASHLVRANASLLEKHAPGDGSLSESERMAGEIVAQRERVLGLCP